MQHDDNVLPVIDLGEGSDAPSQGSIHQGEDGQGIICRPCGSPRLEEAEVLLREDSINPRGLEDRRIEQAAVEERDSTQALGLLIRAGREEAMIWPSVSHHASRRRRRDPAYRRGRS